MDETQALYQPPHYTNTSKQNSTLAFTFILMTTYRSGGNELKYLTRYCREFAPIRGPLY